MMKTLKMIVLATVLAAAPACSNKKTEEGKAPPATDTTGSAATGSGSAAPDTGSAAGSDTGSAAGSAAATTPDAAADYIHVMATHAKPKPDDPVHVAFNKFTVTKASFDPKNLEGGTATIEVDLTSISSGSAKRDGHLSSPDYIDTAKFATMTIDVSDVKKKTDTTYDAKAKVKLRDIEKTYPITFEVVGAGDDWVKVKGEHKFSKDDFKVGKANDPEESVAQELTAALQLTLKKT